MASRRLVQSSSNLVLHETAAAFLREHPEVLILAPSRGAADDLVRKYVPPSGATVTCHRMTPLILASQLALPFLDPGEKPAAALAFEALSARIIKELCDQGQLPYFSPVADSPGLARAVSATVAELRLNRVTPQEVAATGAPGEDLGRILARFEEECGALLDLPDVLARATRNTSHPLLKLPIIWLGCEIPSLDHGLFSRHVLTGSPHVLALIPAHDLPNLQSLQAILGVEPEALTLDTPMEQVAASLFATERTPAHHTCVSFFSAPGEGLECVEIARNLRKLAAQGIPFDEMAILLRSPERYQTLVEEALRRAGIPAHYSRGVARPDPAGRAFLALLACAAEGLSATRFAEYLSLGQTPSEEDRRTNLKTDLPPDDELLQSFSSAGTAPALEAPQQQQEESIYVATPAAWERMLVDAAVIGGRDRWERRLNGLQQELKFKLSAATRDNAAKAEQLDRQLRQLQTLSAFALPLIRELDALPRRARWGEWLDALQPLAQTSLKSPAAVVAVLEELRAMAEIGPVELGEVYGVLSDRLRFLRREPGSARYGKVFVAPVSEARGRLFRAVFLPGLTEGVFPRRAMEDPILLDTHRDKIDKPLVNQAERVRRERMLLQLATGCASDQLMFSYPRMDVMMNRPRVPSFYALELLRAIRGVLPDLRSFEVEAAENAPSRLEWPTSRNLEDAIDDAEFDLAMLRTNNRTGAGRYLLDANANLSRSLRARAGRWRQKWFPSDGLVDPNPQERKALQLHRLDAKPYSPSALQTYAACPYKFLLQAIHRLEPREEPVSIEQLDPLTRGEIFHDVQFRLMQRLSSQDALPVTRANRDTAIAALDDVLNTAAREYQDKLAPAIPRVWHNEIEELRTDLRAWLIHVSEHSYDWVPIHFELSFGLENPKDPAGQTTPVTLSGSGFIVRGSIDLVERNAKSGVIRITDHKTGSFPQRRPTFTAGGSVLQPILYSAVARQLLKGAQVESGRLYFCTRKGDYKEVVIPINPVADDALHNVLQAIDKAVEEGFLPAYPKPDACEQCDYRLVCGPYEVERTSRKRSDRVLPLRELREQP
ncbi:hypothetical protein F183_A19900 [Bryobacterales bacterium F-183]|nr:hypothetical protein F183_A19900 [Bryobacterales bacterium F-183]